MEDDNAIDYSLFIKTDRSIWSKGCFHTRNFVVALVRLLGEIRKLESLFYPVRKGSRKTRMLTYGEGVERSYGGAVEFMTSRAQQLEHRKKTNGTEAGKFAAQRERRRSTVKFVEQQDNLSAILYELSSSTDSDEYEDCSVDEEEEKSERTQVSKTAMQLGAELQAKLQGRALKKDYGATFQKKRRRKKNLPEKKGAEYLKQKMMKGKPPTRLLKAHEFVLSTIRLLKKLYLIFFYVPKGYLFDPLKDIAAMDVGPELRQKLQIERWETAVLQDWENQAVTSTDGQLDYFANLITLQFCLLDIFKNMDSSGGGQGEISYNQLLAYFADCAIFDEKETCSTQLYAIPQWESQSFAFRVEKMIVWEKKNALVIFKLTRAQEQIIDMVDAATNKIIRHNIVGKEHGAISGMELIDTYNLIALSFYDAIRFFDADNWLLKGIFKQKDNVTVMRWIGSVKVFVVGNSCGQVLEYDVAPVDRWIFNNDNQPFTTPEFFARQSHKETVTDVLPTTPSNSIVTAGMDGTVVLSHVESRSFRVLKGPIVFKMIVCETYGILVSYGVDPVPFVWVYNVSEAKPLSFGGKVKGHSERIFELSLLHNDRYAMTMSSDGETNIWDLKELLLVQTIQALETDPNGKYIHVKVGYYNRAFKTIYAMADGKKKIYKMKYNDREEKKQVLMASYGAISNFTYCPVSKLFITSKGGDLSVWNGVTGREISMFPAVCGEGEVITALHVDEAKRKLHVGVQRGVIYTLNLGTMAIAHKFLCPALEAEKEKEMWEKIRRDEALAMAEAKKKDPMAAAANAAKAALDRQRNQRKKNAAANAADGKKSTSSPKKDRSNSPPNSPSSNSSPKKSEGGARKQITGGGALTHEARCLQLLHHLDVTVAVFGQTAVTLCGKDVKHLCIGSSDPIAVRALTFHHLANVLLVVEDKNNVVSAWELMAKKSATWRRASGLKLDTEAPIVGMEVLRSHATHSFVLWDTMGMIYLYAIDSSGEEKQCVFLTRWVHRKPNSNFACPVTSIVEVGWLGLLYACDETGQICIYTVKEWLQENIVRTKVAEIKKKHKIAKQQHAQKLKEKAGLQLMQFLQADDQKKGRAEAMKKQGGEEEIENQKSKVPTENPPSHSTAQKKEKSSSSSSSRGETNTKISLQEEEEQLQNDISLSSLSVTQLEQTERRVYLLRSIIAHIDNVTHLDITNFHRPSMCCLVSCGRDGYVKIWSLYGKKLGNLTLGDPGPNRRLRLFYSTEEKTVKAASGQGGPQAFKSNNSKKKNKLSAAASGSSTRLSKNGEEGNDEEEDMLDDPSLMFEFAHEDNLGSTVFRAHDVPRRFLPRHYRKLPTSSSSDTKHESQLSHIHSAVLLQQQKSVFQDSKTENFLLEQMGSIALDKERYYRQGLLPKQKKQLRKLKASNGEEATVKGGKRIFTRKRPKRSGGQKHHQKHAEGGDVEAFLHEEVEDGSSEDNMQHDTSSSSSTEEAESEHESTSSSESSTNSSDSDETRKRKVERGEQGKKRKGSHHPALVKSMSQLHRVLHQQVKPEDRHRLDMLSSEDELKKNSFWKENVLSVKEAEKQKRDAQLTGGGVDSSPNPFDDMSPSPPLMIFEENHNDKGDHEPQKGGAAVEEFTLPSIKRVQSMNVETPKIVKKKKGRNAFCEDDDEEEEGAQGDRDDSPSSLKLGKKKKSVMFFNQDSQAAFSPSSVFSETTDDKNSPPVVLRRAEMFRKNYGDEPIVCNDCLLVEQTVEDTLTGGGPTSPDDIGNFSFGGSSMLGDASFLDSHGSFTFLTQEHGSFRAGHRAAAQMDPEALLEAKKKRLARKFSEKEQAVLFREWMAIQRANLGGGSGLLLSSPSSPISPFDTTALPFGGKNFASVAIHLRQLLRMSLADALASIDEKEIMDLHQSLTEPVRHQQQSFRGASSTNLFSPTEKNNSSFSSPPSSQFHKNEATKFSTKFYKEKTTHQLLKEAEDIQNGDGVVTKCLTFPPNYSSQTTKMEHKFAGMKARHEYGEEIVRKMYLKPEELQKEKESDAGMPIMSYFNKIDVLSRRAEKDRVQNEPQHLKFFDKRTLWRRPEEQYEKVEHHRGVGGKVTLQKLPRYETGGRMSPLMNEAVFFQPDENDEKEHQKTEEGEEEGIGENKKISSPLSGKGAHVEMVKQLHLIPGGNNAWHNFHPNAAQQKISLEHKARVEKGKMDHLMDPSKKGSYATASSYSTLLNLHPRPLSEGAAEQQQVTTTSSTTAQQQGPTTPQGSVVKVSSLLHQVYRQQNNRGGTNVKQQAFDRRYSETPQPNTSSNSVVQVGKGGRGGKVTGKPQQGYLMNSRN